MLSKSIFLFFILTLILFSFNSIRNTSELQAGAHRWKIKTSAENLNKEQPKNIPLKQLLALPLFSSDYNFQDYENRFIPIDIAPNLKEGDIISTTGYLHLVALEDGKKHKDGDFHIQLTLHSYWADSCFVIEIPYEKFVEVKELKTLCEKNRKYIRDIILKTGREPAIPDTVIENGVYVKVEGQLFYDANHAKGRKPKASPDLIQMRSYTAWEIHPVTHIELVN